MKETTKIREIILGVREMVSSVELDSSQRKRLWDDIRELEGLHKKFRSKGSSQINRKALTAAFAKLSADLLEVFSSRDR